MRPWLICIAMTAFPLFAFGLRMRPSGPNFNVADHPLAAVGLLALLANWVSVITFWVTMAPMRRTLKLALGLATAAIFAAIGIVLLVQPDWVVWQCGLGGVMQSALLSCLLSCVGALGVRLAGSEHLGKRAFAASQYPLRDLVVIILLAALLLGILRRARPVGDPLVFYIFLFFFGSALALNAGATVWVVLGQAAVHLRFSVFFLCLPIGLLPAEFFGQWLMFPAWWYGMLTIAHGVYVFAMLAVFRAHGYRLIHCTSELPIGSVGTER